MDLAPVAPGDARALFAIFSDPDGWWYDEHNVPSRRVAERIGLVDRGPHVDPSDGATRLAYADRPFPG